ncbi:MAG: 50S ribosomal protein L25 [bacterium]
MSITLDAKKRSVTGKKVYALRQSGKIPAVLYGHGTENVNLELEYVPFDKAYQEAGSNTIVDVSIDGKKTNVLISEVDFDAVSGRYTHIDLLAINMKEEITTSVELTYVGESFAVKSEGGVLVHNINELEIRCLPGDLIHEIIVDLSALKTFDDVIRVKDLKLDAKHEVIGHGPEDAIASVIRHKAEVEAPVVAAPVADAPKAGETTPAAGAPKAEEKKK